MGYGFGGGYNQNAFIIFLILILLLGGGYGYGGYSADKQIALLNKTPVGRSFVFCVTAIGFIQLWYRIQDKTQLRQIRWHHIPGNSLTF